ncbi:MAG TPA: Vps62-related protein [Gaiellaceae bacterium]|jgi:hypothetical protein
MAERGRDETPLPLRELTLDIAVGVVLALALLALDLVGFDTVPVLAALAAAFVPWLVARWRRVKIHAAVERLLAFPIDLVLVLAPLVLPVLVLVLYAARVLGLAGELALGAIAGAVVALVAAHEAPGVRATIEGFARGVAVSVAAVGGLLALATVAAILVMLALAPGLRQYGGWPAILESAALALLSAAFVLRLCGLPSGLRARWVLVAVVLAVWARFVVVWTGFPGGWIADRLYDWFHAGDRWWALAALFVVGAFAVVEAVTWLRTGSGRPATTRFADWSRRWGFLAAMTSAVVFVVAFAAAAIDAQAPDLAHRRSQPVEIAGENLEDADADTIARAFRPTIELAADEKWAPTDVTRYLANTDLYDTTTDEVVDDAPVDLKSRDRRCADPTQNTCFYLSCSEERAEACVRSSTEADPVVVYAHVMRRDIPGQARFFADGPGWTGELSTIVEYWFFYPYDRWEAVTPVGYLVQQHEGDWEAIVIGISGDLPRVIGFSSHCGGHWFRWSDAERDGTHPVVAVALGSHANYRHEWSGRPPDWGSCRNVPEDATWALTYASNVRDTTGGGRTIEWKSVGVHTIRDGDKDDARIFSFPGRWGRQDTTTVGGIGTAHATHELGEPGPGPTSPGIKRLWNRPLATMFRPPWHEGDTG